MCGSDGVTYSNSCAAAAACQLDATDGECSGGTVPAVVFTATVSAATFDADAYRQGLAGLVGATAEDITLAVEAATSGRRTRTRARARTRARTRRLSEASELAVTATIRTTTDALAASIQTALQAKTIDELSADLGVAVTSVTAPVVTVAAVDPLSVIVLAASPPPPPPSPPSPPSPPLPTTPALLEDGGSAISTGGDDGPWAGGLGYALAGLAGVAAGLGCALGVLRRRLAASKSSLALARPLGTGVLHGGCAARLHSTPALSCTSSKSFAEFAPDAIEMPSPTALPPGGENKGEAQRV